MTNRRYPFQKSWRWQIVKCLDFFFDRFQKINSSKPFPQTVEKILIIRLDHIGDLICTLPMFGLIKERFPRAKMTVLTGIEGKAILQNNPFVDELIIFHPNWFSRKSANVIARRPLGRRSNLSFRLLRLCFEHCLAITTQWKSFFKILSQLRKNKFDLGYDFRGDLRNILLMVWGGVRYRIGYGIAGGLGLLNQAGEYDQQLHQTELNLRLLKGPQPNWKDLKPEIFLTPDEINEAKQILKKAGILNQNTLIALHPEAGYSSKEWEEKNVRRLIQLLIQDKQNKIMILGLGRAQKIAESLNGSDQVINLVGKLSLRQMISIIGQANIFVGNDSGPSHIAQALGIPVLVIASGTNEYEKWGIWRQPSKILSHAVSCAPCHLNECVVEGHPCMSNISGEDAFRAVKQLFSEVA